MPNIDLLKTLKILFVEDEIPLRDITCKSLSSIVKEIVVANNGQEGLEKFSNESFDLIITDLAMPIMGGVEMIKSIRAIDGNIPILVTTAFGSDAIEISQLEEIGMDYYVMKPVDVMKLVQAIDKVI